MSARIKDAYIESTLQVQYKLPPPPSSPGGEKAILYSRKDTIGFIGARIVKNKFSTRQKQELLTAQNSYPDLIGRQLAAVPYRWDGLTQMQKESQNKTRNKTIEQNSQIHLREVLTYSPTNQKNNGGGEKCQIITACVMSNNM